jgi:subtilisin family serine protease
MLQARSPILALANRVTPDADPALLTWSPDWEAADGDGITIGLVDAAVTSDHPDLVDADIEVRNFAARNTVALGVSSHAMHASTILVGQGKAHMLGVVPRARLRVAAVVDGRNIAQAQDVGAALAWLVSCGARIIAIPLGDAIERPELIESIHAATTLGSIIFAAAGNTYPAPVMFPARARTAVAVAAVDARGHLLTSSCRWPRIDLAAPGDAIRAPVDLQRVEPRSGSSVACVLAAGVAALVLPGLTGAHGLPTREEMLDIITGKGKHAPDQGSG